jgi:hypothetical protein
LRRTLQRRPDLLNDSVERALAPQDVKLLMQLRESQLREEQLRAEDEQQS